MRELTLASPLGSTVTVNACLLCRAFWFDPFESLQLTRASTLELFQLISAQRASSGPFPTDARCPRCGEPLLLTHDRQKATAFQYWRCDAGHGRFTPFLDFLREKDFVKPLSPQQVDELRKDIRIIRCSQCGAPVDLEKESACLYCGAQITMLDLPRMRGAVSAGPRAQTSQSISDGALQRQVELLLESSPRETEPPHPVADLMELGLEAMAKWWRGKGGA